ncbi:MAG: DUF2793 domain-containing protein [Sphingomonadales bacterium]|nr:MAG: DUF2793 domain-containing protein [Sphingomonadales bacterium]
MSEPIAFPAATPALGLPLLIAGQSQKEFFVNQALCLLDALHARAVTASRSTPPASVDDGESFRILATATGVWAGHDGRIAVRVGGDWHFVVPTEGMQIFDRDAGRLLVFRSQWRPAIAPSAPSGGVTIDTEARAALAELIQALLAIGILGTPAG